MEDREFERLLRTARIFLDENEKKQISSDIDEILGFFDRLDGFHSDGEYSFHSVDIAGKLRDDSLVSREDRDMLNNADSYRFFVLGPKV